jgi:hypothetical protein
MSLSDERFYAIVAALRIEVDQIDHEEHLIGDDTWTTRLELARWLDEVAYCRAFVRASKAVTP